MGNPRSGCNKPQCAVGAIRTLTWLYMEHDEALGKYWASSLVGSGSSPPCSKTLGKLYTEVPSRTGATK